jgi:DNA replication and repair protein RecF
VNFKRVELVHFRNFDSIEIQLNPGINVLVGPNGQGKTNFLESLYFLSKGSSFRTTRPEHLIKEGHTGQNSGAHIKATFTRNKINSEVEAHLVDSQKRILLNQKKVPSSQLAQVLPCVLFSPESLLAIKEGPNLRRDLIDEMIVILNSDNIQVLTEFQKALKTRNQVLKLAEDKPKDFDLLLDTVNKVFLEKAAQLTLVRMECLTEINPHVSSIMKMITGDTSKETFVEYLISDEPVTRWSEAQVYDALYNRMAQLRVAEIATGLSLVGPHRHDIKVLYGNRDSRYFCSQGQQRALILALKMTQIVQHHRKYGSFPTLFLDDVLSELDNEKRSFLIDFLMSIDTQSILTATDFSLFGELTNKLTIFQVKNGTIEV